MIKTIVLFLICLTVALVSALGMIDNYYDDNWPAFFWNVFATAAGIAGCMIVFASTFQEEEDG